MLNRLFGKNKTPEEWFESARKRYQQLNEKEKQFTLQQIQNARSAGYDPSAYERFRQEEFKDYRAMIADLDKATDARPDFTDAWFNKACLYDLLELPEKALECLSRTLACAPQHANSLFMIGHILTGQNRSPEAIPYFRKALGINPNDGEAWIELSMALSNTGEQEASGEARERAYELRPDLGPNDRGIAVYVATPRLFA